MKWYWICNRCKVHLWDGVTVNMHTPECQKTFLPNGTITLVRETSTCKKCHWMLQSHTPNNLCPGGSSGVFEVQEEVTI